MYNFQAFLPVFGPEEMPSFVLHRSISINLNASGYSDNLYRL